MQEILPIKGIQLENEEQIYTFNADTIIYDYDEQGQPISVKQALGGLLYTPITISNLSHNLDNSVFEYGSRTFSSIQLNWSVNNVKSQEGLSQFLNNKPIQPAIINGKYSYTENIALGQSAGTNTFTIKAQENTLTGVSEDTKSININFYKPIYYGCTNKDPDKDALLKVDTTKILQSSANKDSITFTPNDQYVFYAIPKTYLGTTQKLIFKDTATQIEYDAFIRKEIKNFNPNKNYTENYWIFRSPYKYTSAVTFKVIKI